MRRKTKKTMTQSTPTSVERQQTMTQAGYVATLSSSKRKRGEHEEAGDFESEVESDEPGSSDEKRQQTLTQMIHGVRPTPGYEDNWKIPALKRRSGNMKTEEKRQRTLTQMTHGLMPIRMVSDDEDEDDNDDNGYALAIDQHLAGHGIYKPSHERSPPKSPVHQHPGILKHLHEWMTNQETQAYHLSSNHVTSLRRPTKAKTENPKTPPRRRLLEVPSSQSPPESPLSTQKSTERHSRYPLEERSSNPRGLLESPSKGRIAATSNSAIRKLVPQTNKVVKEERFSPTPLDRIFQSTIQDSDEEEELGSDDEDADTNNHAIGDEAQAVTNQIDLACTNTDPMNSLNENVEDGGRINENDLRLSVGSNLTSVPAERTNSGQSKLRETGQPTYVQFKSFQAIMHASQPEESQDSIGTGTEEAAAQLQTELEFYTQRQNTRQPPGFRISHLEQSNQRIQDSNPIPTQSSHLSQATTVDSTQPSSHNAHHSRLPLPVSPSRSPPLTIPSSLPSFLSSPNISRGNTSAESPSLKRTGAGIVTASQMVPESLDDYSIPPPPPWNDDDDDDYDDEEL